MVNAIIKCGIWQPGKFQLVWCACPKFLLERKKNGLINDRISKSRPVLFPIIRVNICTKFQNLRCSSSRRIMVEKSLQTDTQNSEKTWHYSFKIQWPQIVCFIQILHHFQKYFSHIETMSGCDRELNAHFKSAASLKQHASKTWHGIPPSHIILIRLTSPSSIFLMLNTMWKSS